MRQERVLQVLLVLIGLFFVAGILPLLTSIPQHQQSDYGDQDDARRVFCARRISANGSAKAGGSSQSDLLRRLGYPGARHCDGSSSFAVETVALGGAALNRSCVSLCRLDGIISTEASSTFTGEPMRE